MKKMLIVLTSALLVGSGLYSMERSGSPVPPSLSPQLDGVMGSDEELYGEAIVRYSIWDRETGLLTYKKSESDQGQIYTKFGENWLVGDARNLAAAASAEKIVVELLNRIVAAKEQAVAMEIAPVEVVTQQEAVTQQPVMPVEQLQQPAQPENTVALKRDHRGNVILNQMVRIKDGIFTVVAVKGGMVLGTVRELGSDVLHAVQAHPYRAAGHVAEGLYFVGAIVAIPATAGAAYVAGAAAPLVTDLALRHGRQALRHVSTGASHVGNAAKAGIKKISKKDSCSLQ